MIVSLNYVVIKKGLRAEMDLIQGTIKVVTTSQTDDVWAIQSAHQYSTAMSRGVDYEMVCKGIVNSNFYYLKLITFNNLVSFILL